MKTRIFFILAVCILAGYCMDNTVLAADDLSCNMKTLRNTTVGVLKNKDYKQVITLYDGCIKKYPNNADLYNNRGNAFMALNNYNQALADYRRAISLNPKYATPYNGIATIYIKTGQTEKALDSLNQLLTVDPNNTTGALNRAQIFMLTKDYQAAIKDYNVVLKDKRLSVYYKDRAYAYLAVSKPEQAIEDYENYLKAGHSSAEAYRYLGIAYGILGDNEKMLANLRTAADLYKKENNMEEYNNIMKVFRSN